MPPQLLANREGGKVRIGGIEVGDIRRRIGGWVVEQTLSNPDRTLHRMGVLSGRIPEQDTPVGEDSTTLVSGPQGHPLKGAPTRPSNP